jgi:hypothetical protein
MRRISPVLNLFIAASLLAHSQASQNRNQTQKPSQSNEVNAQSQSARPFTSEEKTRIIRTLLETPRLAATLRNQRYRVLSVALAPDSKVRKDETKELRIAVVVLFNYTSSKATRFLVDSSTGEILAEEELRGRPQPSGEERQEAAEVIRQDRSLASVLREGGIIEGGFAVADPNEHKPPHRCIQFQLLSGDRTRLLRVVVVDLNDSIIALSRNNY